MNVRMLVFTKYKALSMPVSNQSEKTPCSYDGENNIQTKGEL